MCSVILWNVYLRARGYRCGHIGLRSFPFARRAYLCRPQAQVSKNANRDRRRPTSDRKCTSRCCFARWRPWYVMRKHSFVLPRQRMVPLPFKYLLFALDTPRPRGIYGAAAPTLACGIPHFALCFLSLTKTDKQRASCGSLCKRRGIERGISCGPHPSHQSESRKDRSTSAHCQ